MSPYAAQLRSFAGFVMNLALAILSLGVLAPMFSYTMSGENVSQLLPVAVAVLWSIINVMISLNMTRTAEELLAEQG